ncbi:7-cyano-7-deazaguanine synthase QueC [Mitsuokella sp.]|uniref:7-cyano-7-deazaguanine synthase QueC n=1 Tax=unclassified Mitsuokella TaxID=2637239 RepID=UPI003D7CAD44
MEKAVVLLSGGLDSCTCMAVAKSKGYEVYPISFNYHQRHSIELEGAKKIAQFYGVKKHLIIETNMEAIGGSALTDEKIEVPEGDVNRTTVPPTYVPARNLIFLSYAMGYAEVLGATHVYIGVNSVDYSGYPDCRPEFIQKFQALADYATTATAVKGQKITIETPLQDLSKKDIVLLGTKLGAPFQFTHSCYKGGEKACGVCDSCKLRLRGFAEAGVEDPIAYETREL